MSGTRIDMLRVWEQFRDVNAQDVDGNTPAHCAAIREYLEILSLLVNHSKYDPNVLNHKLQSGDDLSPIHKILLDLDSSLDVDSRHGFAKLFKHGKLLCDSDGNNVLHHLCADQKFSDAARVLPIFLTYDPSLRSQQNVLGNCLIHSTASSGQIAILKELLRYPADDINAPNTIGNTCLHLAIIHNKTDMVKHLIRIRDIDRSLRHENESGNCPIHSAASSGQTAILKELIIHTADDVNLQNSAGNTCLHLAVIHNRDETVKHLMKLRGVDPDLRNEDNKTACDLARELNKTSAYSAILYTHVSDATDITQVQSS